MDDVELMSDDSFSIANDDQLEIDIEESTSQGIHNNFPENRKTEEQVYFFGKIKTIFEVSDERTAEEAKTFLKVHNLIFIIIDSSHNIPISSGDFSDVRDHRLHGHISLKEFIILLANHVRFASPVTAI